jgi:glycosyltransferase involved in cell wall biosynthesis
VFTLQTGGPLLEELKQIGVDVISGGLKKGDLSSKPWKLLQTQWSLFRIIKKIKPDIIHSFLPLVTFMGAFSGRLMHIPLVITSRRGLSTHQKRHPVLRPFDLMANFFSHHIAVNSKGVFDDVVIYDRVSLKKLILIYNGIKTIDYESATHNREKIRAQLGLGSFDKIITVVANYIPYKGHMDFLQAAEKITKRFPNAKFWLIGEDRGIKDQLKEKSDRLGIGDSTRFWGQRSDIPELLAASDIAVMPSHEEGFSNVILESMAAGLPVVATDVGGNSEAVLNGETGWIVPPKSPEQLAEKVMDFLQDQKRAKEWGVKGQKRVKELFSIDQMIQGYLALYQSDQCRTLL